MPVFAEVVEPRSLRRCSTFQRLVFAEVVERVFDLQPCRRRPDSPNLPRAAGICQRIHAFYLPFFPDIWNTSSPVIFHDLGLVFAEVVEKVFDLQPCRRRPDSPNLPRAAGICQLHPRVLPPLLSPEVAEKVFNCPPEVVEKVLPPHIWNTSAPRSWRSCLPPPTYLPLSQSPQGRRLICQLHPRVLSAVLP